jgi:hypothetical protein
VPEAVATEKSACQSRIHLCKTQSPAGGCTERGFIVCCYALASCCLRRPWPVLTCTGHGHDNLKRVLCQMVWWAQLQFTFVSAYPIPPVVTRTPAHQSRGRWPRSGARTARGLPACAPRSACAQLKAGSIADLPSFVVLAGRPEVTIAQGAAPANQKPGRAKTHVSGCIPEAESRSMDIQVAPPGTAHSCPHRRTG